MNGAALKPSPLSNEDLLRLKRFVGGLATTSGAANDYFTSLLMSAALTQPFQQEALGLLEKNAENTAIRLIKWAETRGGNPLPSERPWTTLGTLLRALLETETLGLEGIALVSGVIEAYTLCPHETKRLQFRSKYGVPTRTAAAAAGPDVGPDIDWKGPTEEVQLQGFFGPTPVDFTVDFILGAARRARSVCKVAFTGSTRSGSGVLIAPDLILTNHHVVFGEAGDETNAAALAKSCVVSFEGLAGTGGKPTAAGPLELTGDPILARSKALDYALLRLSAGLSAAQGLEPAPLSTRQPVEKDGMNLLHHPGGAAMRVSLTDAGITSIVNVPGYLQYVTRSAPGSSGAPCFDDEWHVTALHHAERSRSFGRVGEGILIDRILPEIQTHL
jgi:endonuclease G